jgi:hypothetical protein
VLDGRDRIRVSMIASFAVSDRRGRGMSLGAIRAEVLAEAAREIEARHDDPHLQEVWHSALAAEVEKQLALPWPPPDPPPIHVLGDDGVLRPVPPSRRTPRPAVTGPPPGPPMSVAGWWRVAEESCTKSAAELIEREKAKSNPPPPDGSLGFRMDEPDFG